MLYEVITGLEQRGFIEALHDRQVGAVLARLGAQRLDVTASAYSDNTVTNDTTYWYKLKSYNFV